MNLKEVNETQPAFEHDCSECVFLGFYERHDLYYCEHGGFAGETVVARFGDDGPAYLSGIVFAEQHPVIGEAVRRAKERGLLKREVS